jgi:hypothetical protein
VWWLVLLLRAILFALSLSFSSCCSVTLISKYQVSLPIIFIVIIISYLLSLSYLSQFKLKFMCGIIWKVGKLICGR